MKTNNKPFNIRILLVDHSEHDRLAFKRAFRTHEYEFTECLRAEDALEKLRIHASGFDLIVSDFNLPGMTGLEFLKQAINNNIQLPMILITGAGSEATAVDALKAGVDDYIIKDPGQDHLKLLPLTVKAVVRKYADRLARRRAEEELKESERRFRETLENIKMVAVQGDSAGKITFANDYLLRLTGWKREEVIGENWLEILIPPVGRDDQGKDFRGFFMKGEKIPLHHETPIVTRGGETRHISWNNTLMHDREGGIVGISAIGEDITDQKRDMERLQLASTVFENASEGVMVTDRESVIQFINPAFSAISGYTPQDVIGKKPSILKSDRHDQKFYEDMWTELLGKGHWQGEILNRRKSGEVYPQWITITGIKNSKGKTVQYAAVFLDISNLKKSESEVKYYAFQDSLTGLPNRRLLNDRLEMALKRAQRDNQKLAVLFLDLDNFKHINDSLGHAFGDLVLECVTVFMMGSCREEETIARLGGDEFVIVLNRVNSELDAMDVAGRIIRAISAPMMIRGKELFIGASIGITLYPSDGTTVSKLLKNADIAMYRAKAMGKNKYHLFTPEMNTVAIKRMEMESNLRKALGKGELTVFYQPKVTLEGGSVIGLEALMRWRDSKGNFIFPSDFIPMAEETGLIICLGEWILQRACECLRKLHDAGFVSLVMSVNLSARQFESRDIVEIIEKSVNEAGIQPRHLELEVTEGTVIRDIDSAVKTLKTLRDLGFLLSIDDFGTGYSSLNYLKKFPISTLKIDKSFVCDLCSDRASLAIARALISMSHEMGIKVLAEGVETEEQLSLLREIGCDEMQGYFFSQPLEESKILKLLQEVKTSADGFGL